MFRFRKNPAPIKVPYTKGRGEARFIGEKVPYTEQLPDEILYELAHSNLPKGTTLVGELEELEMETPLEPKVNAFNLLKSEKTPLVVASGKGDMVLIISGDSVKEETNIDPDNQSVKDAVDLHEAFHGTPHDKIFTVDIKPVNTLVFLGHLNYIVYSVPNYSERRGVPFIHEAKDRGDDVPPAEKKPVICMSKNKDFMIMYGAQFEFTERGIIG